MDQLFEDFAGVLAAIAVVAGFIAAIGKFIVVRTDAEWQNWSGKRRTGKVLEAIGPLIVGAAGLGAILGYLAATVTV